MQFENAERRPPVVYIKLSAGAPRFTVPKFPICLARRHRRTVSGQYTVRFIGLIALPIFFCGAAALEGRPLTLKRQNLRSASPFFRSLSASLGLATAGPILVTT